MLLRTQGLLSLGRRVKQKHLMAWMGHEVQSRNVLEELWNWKRPGKGGDG